MTAHKIPVVLFHLGRVVATPNALRSLTSEDIGTAISSHQEGQWGDLSSFDRQQNELALEQGGRIFSAYRTSKGQKFYVITEANRSVTTVLLLEDY